MENVFHIFMFHYDDDDDFLFIIKTCKEFRWQILQEKKTWILQTHTHIHTYNQNYTILIGLIYLLNYLYLACLLACSLNDYDVYKRNVDKGKRREKFEEVFQIIIIIIKLNHNRTTKQQQKKSKPKAPNQYIMTMRKRS